MFFITREDDLLLEFRAEIIAVLAYEFLGCRVRLVLNKPDHSPVVKNSAKTVISTTEVELTSHGCDDEGDTIGDDNYGYALSMIRNIQYVRGADSSEMGALRVVKDGDNEVFAMAPHFRIIIR
jgi:hypothetical protein